MRASELKLEEMNEKREHSDRGQDYAATSNRAQLEQELPEVFFVHDMGIPAAVDLQHASESAHEIDQSGHTSRGLAKMLRPRL